MARITVEDCIKLVNNQYDLVILAKERAVQLGEELPQLLILKMIKNLLLLFEKLESQK